MLSWTDIMDYKVRWGFDGEVKIIEDFVSKTDIK